MKKVAYILVFFHLTLITVVIFHGLDPLVHGSPVEKPLAFLCSLNYSVWQYGFFSPDVGKSTEVEIKVYQENGDTLRYSTLEGFRFFLSNEETNNRFYGFKVNTAADTTFLDLCARSASVHLLNLHPEGWRVDYHMRSIRYPTMDEFRQNAPVQKADLYETSFALR